MNASPRFRSSQSCFVRVPCFVRVLFPAAMALCATWFSGSNVLAESPMPHSTHTTLVIFADHPIGDDLWTALVDQLHKGQASEASLIPGLSGELDVFRGSDLIRGVMVQVGISVFLNGDCTLLPRPKRFVEGALGWVPLIDGEIQPFEHVDCTRIVEMLGPLVLGMNRCRRNTVMAEAMARVILHEWIHIATQKAGHGESGITKSQFQVRDLLAEDEQIYPRQQVSRDKRRVPGF